MQKVLIAEDDKEISQLLCTFLSTQGYVPIPALNGLDAVRLAGEQRDIDLILLDLMLPFQSGDMVLQKVRAFSNVPVIVVSAKGVVQSKVDLIRMGADDYLTKPFDLDELLARMEAVLRRTERNDTSAASANCLTYRKLVLIRENATVFVDGQPLLLTSKEYAILERLLLHPTKLFSKSNLFESVWNEPYFKDDTTIKVHMSNLRSKIRKLDDSQEYIETVWGMGYKLCR